MIFFRRRQRTVPAESPPKPPPKFCIDCTHYFKDGTYECCKLTAIPEYVHGGQRYISCQTCRNERGMCGEEGKWFKGK